MHPPFVHMPRALSILGMQAPLPCTCCRPSPVDIPSTWSFCRMQGTPAEQPRQPAPVGAGLFRQQRPHRQPAALPGQPRKAGLPQRGRERLQRQGAPRPGGLRQPHLAHRQRQPAVWRGASGAAAGVCWAAWVAFGGPGPELLQVCAGLPGFWLGTGRGLYMFVTCLSLVAQHMAVAAWGCHSGGEGDMQGAFAC